MLETTLTINIPPEFWDARYDASCYPGMADWKGLRSGANCQQFAYEILRHNGSNIPDFRSSDLWEDTRYTEVVSEFLPLDLLLFNRTTAPWGAHIALYVGSGKAIHLAKKIGSPTIWTFDEFSKFPEYKHLIGGKRIK